MTRLTLVFEDAQCFKSDSQPSSCRDMKNNDNELFRCSLKCQISMNLVFHISEDGTDIVTQRFLSISD